MTTTYQPTRVAARVTPDHKRAVWAAIVPPARLDLPGIAAATGIDSSIVIEIWAEGSAAGRLREVNQGPGFRWIERVEDTE